MALKPSPTLLYRAPPHTAFFIGSYVFGFFCMSYAGWNFYMHYLYPPEGLATWVPVAFGGVCIFMVCVGTYLILAPTRWVPPLDDCCPHGRFETLLTGFPRLTNPRRPILDSSGP